MTGAIEHYRATLRLEPEYPGGIDQLRIPSCYIKYHQSPLRDHSDSSCVRNEPETKCPTPQQRQEIEEASCVQRKYEENTLTSIQVKN